MSNLSHLLSGANLREAGPGDFCAIAALEQTCFTAEDGLFSPRQLRRLLTSPNAYWLLAVDGQAMGCWLKAGNGYRQWARLYSLAVHPKARGQGRAQALLNAGFAWMQENALTICRAEVKADNNSARGLYARMGFSEVVRLDNYYGPGISGLRLVKRLDNPAITPTRHAA